MKMKLKGATGNDGISCRIRKQYKMRSWVFCLNYPLLFIVWTLLWSLQYSLFQSASFFTPTGTPAERRNDLFPHASEDFILWAVVCLYLSLKLVKAESTQASPRSNNRNHNVFLPRKGKKLHSSVNVALSLELVILFLWKITGAVFVISDLQ